MITLEQLTEMLEMQEALEVRIDGPDWRNKGHDYRLCIHMECAEIIDHVGWKHWKKHDGPDWDAIAMELVDVWHFAMAHALTFEDFEPQLLHDGIIGATKEYMQHDSTHSMVELALGLGYSIMVDQQICMGSFIAMMDQANMSWNQLYRLYVGKNILNWFRQDHGYREGLYMKTWAGKEDNVHLFELTEMLGDSFSSVELVKALSARYALAGH